MRTADAELFKEKIEVTLDGRQIFYLFFGGAVIASLVFVLGVVVGRRVEAQSDLAQASASAADPLSALDQLEAAKPGRLSFSSRLAGGPGADRQPLGAVDRSIAGDDGAGDGSGGAAGAATAAQSGTAAASKKPATSADSQNRNPATAADRDAKPPKSENKPAREVKAAASAEPAAAKSNAAAAKTEPAAAAKFTLQLSSFQDRGQAESFYDELESNGYEPYIIAAQVPKKGAYWRVRLGKYPSYHDAVAAKKKFEARMHIIAYVTRL